MGYACEWEGVSDSPDHVASDKKLCTFNKEFSDCTSNQGKKPSFIIWVFPGEKLSSDLPVTKTASIPSSMKRKSPKIERALQMPSHWVMTTTPSRGRIATSTWVRVRDETSSSRYNEVKRLCHDDRDAWFQCLEIVLLPRPLPSTEHFVRRSVRTVGRDQRVESPAGPLEGILFRDLR